MAAATGDPRLLLYLEAECDDYGPDEELPAELTRALARYR